MAKTGIINRMRIATVAFVLTAAANIAQAQSLKTAVDKQNILIGEQINYTVTASFPANTFKLHWFSIPDSIPYFEVVEKTNPDSTTSGDNITVKQNIIFTSFDSGKWALPVLMVNFDPLQDDTTINLFTDSVYINVSYAPADTTTELRDIKPIIGVTLANYLWYYIAGGVLLLLIVTYFIYRYVKNKQQQQPAKFISKLSAFDEAMQELEKLKKADTNAQLKYFYTRLAEIFKWYISRKQGKDIMSFTTYDVLILLSQNGLANEPLSNVATALRTGDAVKFAKYQPSPADNDYCFNEIKTTIKNFETGLTN